MANSSSRFGIKSKEEDLELQDASDLPDYASQHDALLPPLHSSSTAAVAKSDDSDAFIASAGLLRVDVVLYLLRGGMHGNGVRTELGSVLLNYDPSLSNFLSTLRHEAANGQCGPKELHECWDIKGIRMRDHGPTLSEDSWARVGARLNRVEMCLEKSEYGKANDRRWWRTFWISLVAIVVAIVVGYALIIGISLHYATRSVH